MPPDATHLALTLAAGIDRAASYTLGVIVLLRLGAMPDRQFRHGAWGKAAWALAVVCVGMGALVPLGPAAGLWRTTRPASRLGAVR